MSLPRTPLSLSEPAAEDYQAILHHTVLQWGVAQMETYDEALLNAFSLLQDNPLIGRPLTGTLKEYRVLPVEKHGIFYRFTNSGIVIVRILHGKMDYRHHLEN